MRRSGSGTRKSWRTSSGRIGLEVDSAAIFDVQVKRIHEYKRQLLNILEIVALLNAMREQPDQDWVPRVKILAGKAAPSYTTAKLIIKLANDVARVVNGDPSVAGRLKVAFLPNYNVSLPRKVDHAGRGSLGADLDRWTRASGTGNMKLALNGALTIGTLDGANIEIRDRVGPDNMFIFGLTAQEVERRRGYDPHHTIEASPRLARLEMHRRRAVLAGRPGTLPRTGRSAAPRRRIHGRGRLRVLLG